MTLTRAEKTVYSVLAAVLLLALIAILSGYGLGVLLLGSLAGMVVIPLAVLAAVGVSRSTNDATELDPKE